MISLSEAQPSVHRLMQHCR